jgi:uncharacterized protein
MKTPQPVAPVLPAARERLALRPIGLESARITDGVWADWQRDNREVTMPHCLRWLEHDGTVDNLRRLAPSASGMSERRGLWFTDSDLYKALEGVAWDLGREPSEDLDALITDVSGILSRAQEPDGYLNSFVQAWSTCMSRPAKSSASLGRPGVGVNDQLQDLLDRRRRVTLHRRGVRR